MADIKASIIITTYNRASILKERSLPSALNQICDYNFECIVVDDCSTDDTEAVVLDFQKKFQNLRYIKQKSNRGLAAARNLGAKIAKGEYVVFLDDDDAFEKNFLQETIKKLNSLPSEFGAVTSARLLIYPSGNKEYHLVPLNKKRFSYSSIDDGWLLRRSVFDKILYDEDLFMDEDADFGIHFFKNFKAVSIEEPLLLKYINENSFSLPSKRRIEGLKKFLAKDELILKEMANKEDLAFFYRFGGRYLILWGERKNALVYFKKAFFTQPTFRNFLHLFCAVCGIWVYKKFFSLEKYIGIYARKLKTIVKTLKNFRY